MRARHPLLPPEIERYRALGRKAEEVINQTCQELQPGVSENLIAGKLAGRCLETHIDATLRLVAFDDRIDNYRHPIPTRKKLESRAMVVLCARSQGLIVNVTRMVSFKPAIADLRRKHDAVCRIDAVLNLASRPGVSLGEVFGKGVAQYRTEGFAEEWRLHHQGGTTGYEGRDVKGTPGETEPIVAPTAVAWNPSIRGTKSEDTFLVTEEGIENLTESTDWPQVRAETELGTLDRCDILIL
jgi:antitoxin VapB